MTQPDLFSQNWATADPDTSREAGEMMVATGTAQRHAEIVLALVRRNPGSTYVELTEAQTGDKRLDRHEVMRRLGDLKNKNLVRQGEARTCRIRGRRMVTWELV